MQLLCIDAPTAPHASLECDLRQEELPELQPPPQRLYRENFAPACFLDILEPDTILHVGTIGQGMPWEKTIPRFCFEVRSTSGRILNALNKRPQRLSKTISLSSYFFMYIKLS